tara:strand:- start:956 stop:1420 length:465 start_codon:yes stop_codon:yes gene_type:complete
MIKIISILFLISNVILPYEGLDKYWDTSYNSPAFMNRINTNHHFSILSNSSNGVLNTYGVFGNSTQFTLNNRTQLYSNLNIMKSMKSENPYIDDLSYSVNLGLQYQLNDNTSLSIGMTIIKAAIHNVLVPTHYKTMLDCNNFNQCAPYNNTYLP